MDYDQTILLWKFFLHSIFLPFVARQDLVLYHMCVLSSILYGKIEEDIFMEQAEGFVDTSPPEFLWAIEGAPFWIRPLVAVSHKLTPYLSTFCV